MSFRTKPVLRMLGGIVAVAVLLGGFGACRTTSPAMPATTGPQPIGQFEPLVYAAQLQHGEGRYADLYAPTSYAVWVGPEVTELKRAEAQKSGEAIEPWLERAAQVLPASYIVVECHMDSAFRDTSVAYDAVAFRNMNVYLELPDGRRVKPIQVLVDPKAKEGGQGTLKSYSRVNLLVFSREDLLLGVPSVPANTPSVRLVLQGIDSKFHFDWQGAGGQRTSPWAPTVKEAAAAAQLGFKDLYGRLQTLAHIFD
jgi:hypothetical protein